jgi:hypothetical protein
MEAFFTDIGLRLGYILLVLGVVAALGFSVMTMAMDLKAALKTIIGIAVLIVIFVISYSLAGNEVPPEYLRYNITPSVSKLIGAFINMAIALFGIGIAAGLAISVYTNIKR